MFKSTNAGESWSPVNTGLTGQPAGFALAIDPQSLGTLYAGTKGGGVLKTVPMFEDVPSDHWAYHFIIAIYDAGITGGCSVNPFLFCPNNIITRGQFITGL